MLRGIRDYFVYNKYKWITKYYTIKQKFSYGKAAPTVNDLIYVDPTNVKRSVHWSIKNVQVNNIWPLVGRLQTYGNFVLGGDWDIQSSHFSAIEDEKYRHIRIGLHQRFVENKSWGETDLDEFLKESEIYDETYQNPKERYDELDRIYESIKQEGYLTQACLKDGEASPQFDEITVAIGRDGELFWLTNGFHRLHLTQIIEEIDRIPVRVGIRHRKWQEKRHTISQAKSITGLDSDVKKILYHPDVQQMLNPRLKKEMGL